MRMIVGGRGENVSPADAPPISAVSSSLTILTTCWPGLSCLETSTPRQPLLHRRRELLDDLEVDVGLEQREADLAHRGVDVVLGQRAALADRGERALELLGEGVEHPGADSRGCSGISPMPGDPSPGRLPGMSSRRLLRRAPAGRRVRARRPPRRRERRLDRVRQGRERVARARRRLRRLPGDHRRHRGAALPRARAVRRRDDRRLPPRRDRPHAPERRGDQHDRPGAARQQRRPRRSTARPSTSPSPPTARGSPTRSSATSARSAPTA